MPSLSHPLLLASRALRQGAVALLLAWLAAGWGAVQAMDWTALGDLARQRALAPFQPVGDKLPVELATLNYDQMRRIRFLEARSTWRGEGLPFEVQYFHLGNYQQSPVRLHELTPGGVRELPYRSDLFDFDGVVGDPQAWGDLGFAGFKLLHPLNSPASSTS
jgi:periplasmic glucans biosynthesis protein